MYADTDFLLALIKENDWLKENAERLFFENEKKIWTSTLVLQELMMIAHRDGQDVEKVVNQACALVSIRPIELTAEMCRKAIWLMKNNSFTPFDAFYALACGEDPIISSDKKYDAVGLKRIKLEEKRQKNS
jgi:predicted nucleic acid-binding protein